MHLQSTAANRANAGEVGHSLAIAALVRHAAIAATSNGAPLNAQNVYSAPHLENTECVIKIGTFYIF